MLKGSDYYRCRTQFALRFGYAGERFRGLAIQPHVPTAAGALKQRFTDAGVIAKALNFAARTDAGVHCEANIATFWIRDLEDKAALITAITKDRNDGLKILTMWQVAVSVHSRANAKGKRYCYRLRGGCDQTIKPDERGIEREGEPLQSRRCWHIYPALDSSKMAEAAQRLVGVHDFTSFRNPKCHAPVPIKEIYGIDITDQSGEIHIHIYGASFLRNMVRILAGTLAQIGAGLRPPAAIDEIFLAQHRNSAGPTAPAHGLTLVEVEFEE